MPDTPVPVITIDGPGGTGKGMICNHLATYLGWHLLDSGALYRILVLAVEKNALKITDTSAIAEIAQSLDVTFKRRSDSDDNAVIFEGVDVTKSIRTEECARVASQIAVSQEIRTALLEGQRRFRRPPGLVADGRDMGTIVFTDALLKIYFTASVDERAKRRHKQLKDKGFNVSVAGLAINIAARDDRDSQRSISPLRPAAGAIVIDTTLLNIATVKGKVERLVNGVVGIASGRY